VPVIYSAVTGVSERVGARVARALEPEGSARVSREREAEEV
jgi:hypothetical protein